MDIIVFVNDEAEVLLALRLLLDPLEAALAFIVL